MPAKDFHIGDILSITTGRLVSPDGMDRIYRILSHMMHAEIYTHMIPYAAGPCKDWLLRQHPGLDGSAAREEVALLSRGIDEADADHDQPAVDAVIAAWLGRMASLFGEVLPVEPLPPGEDGEIDPIHEAVRISGKDNVIFIRPHEEGD